MRIIKRDKNGEEIAEIFDIYWDEERNQTLFLGMTDKYSGVYVYSESEVEIIDPNINFRTIYLSGHLPGIFHWALIEKDLLELKYIEKNKKNTDNRYTLPIYIDEKQLEKIGIENYQDYLINWISIGYLKMLIKIHDFLINYYNLTLEKGLKIDDVMLVLIDILDTEIKDFPKGLKKSIEVGKETSGKCFFINKIIQPVSLTPELTLLLQGKDAYNIVPRI